MYEITIETKDDYETTVKVQEVKIFFEGDNHKEEAHSFVLKLLKETGRIGY